MAVASICYQSSGCSCFKNVCRSTLWNLRVTCECYYCFSASHAHLKKLKVLCIARTDKVLGPAEERYLAVMTELIYSSVRRAFVSKELMCVKDCMIVVYWSKCQKRLKYIRCEQSSFEYFTSHTLNWPRLPSSLPRPQNRLHSAELCTQGTAKI